MERKSAKDYRKERLDIFQQTKALNKRIIKRANDLCKEYPNVKVLGTPAKKFMDKFTEYETYQHPNGEYLTVSVDGALQVIEAIEQHIAEQHPFKQGTIEGFN